MIEHKSDSKSDSLSGDPRESRAEIPMKPRSPVQWSAESCVQIVEPAQLDGKIAAAWANIRSQNSDCASPYFDIEFTRSVARVRKDIEIAIVTDRDEKIVGCLPYQRIGMNQAEPVGGLLNDVHGPIADPNFSQISILSQVMDAAGLRSFGFHAFRKTDRSIEPFEFSELDAHFLDLSVGWDVYQQWSRQRSTLLSRQRQKTRALERRHGPLRLEFNCTDPAVLERLIKLKREKYQRTHTFDILSVDWASNLIREIFNVDKPGFKGSLSALFAGEKLVAAHFGMLTDGILHYWFPVFDPQYAKFSPGTELLLRVAETASTTGIQKVDLGYGDDPYKYKFCNGIESVSCGQVVFNRMAFQLSKQRYDIRQRLKGIPMKPLAKSVLRGMFPGFGQWNFK